MATSNRTGKPVDKKRQEAARRGAWTRHLNEKQRRADLLREIRERGQDDTAGEVE